MKDLILIINYSPDNKRKELLRNLISSINNDDFDTMIVTHSFVPQDISDKVDYIFYEKENLLLTDIKSKYSMVWQNDEFTVTTTECKKYNHGYAVLRLILLGLKSAKSLNYVKVHLFEYDSEIKNDFEIKENSTLLNDHPIIWYKWENFQYPSSPLSYNLLKISDSWFNTTKENLMEFFDGDTSKTCEEYHMNLINESENVLQKDMKLLTDNGVNIGMNTDILQYQWVVPVYYPKENRMFLFSSAKNEIENMQIKLIINNSKVYEYVVEIDYWMTTDIDNVNNIDNITIIVNNTLRNYIDFSKINKDYYISKNKLF